MKSTPEIIMCPIIYAFTEHERAFIEKDRVTKFYQKLKFKLLSKVD